ncbi:MAG: LutC/YkgG family protein [Bacteroidota bacterium]
MSETARSRILGRLRAAPVTAAPALPAWEAPTYAAGERVGRFCELLRNLHAEVYEVTLADWPYRLRTLLEERGIGSVMFAPTTEAGRRLTSAWGDIGPKLVPYDRPVEDLKDTLVHGVEAGFTTAQGGIAETGTLVLWPNGDEPRLLSLLPPVHIALVRADAIVDNLAGLMRGQGWAARMPTNVVLVSGPSKTADIEQTLAYGVHGPKELIVLVVGD